MEFKIFVENLSSYNDGDSKGKWFSLPVEMDDIFLSIFNKDELDENGQPHGDWAIHDYDFPIPFRVHEYDSIEDWNEIVQEIKRVIPDNMLVSFANGQYDANCLKQLAIALNLEHEVEHFVDLDTVIDSLMKELKDGNIYSVKNKLNHVRLDSIQRNELLIEMGTGCYRTIDDTDLNSILTSIVDAFANEKK